VLVPLLPTQISNNWEFFAPLILEALPPSTRYSYGIGANVLRSILAGELVCWGIYWPSKEDGKFHALVTTTEVHDAVSGQRNLLVYTLTGVLDLSDIDLWKTSIQTLLSHAQAIGCDAVTAYTSNRGIKAMIERLGGDAEFSFLELKLN
jgi:hypothetical protein